MIKRLQQTFQEMRPDQVAGITVNYDEIIINLPLNPPRDIEIEIRDSAYKIFIRAHHVTAITDKNHFEECIKRIYKILDDAD